MEAKTENFVIKSDCHNVSSLEEFDRICRCCLSAENDFCSVFEVLCDENNFSELLHSCTSIHVSILLLITLYHVQNVKYLLTRVCR